MLCPGGFSMSTLKDYYRISPDEICDDVLLAQDEKEIFTVENIDFVVLPHVYPSQKFRTTGFLLKNLKDLVPGKKICDMGCGPGIVGLYALRHGTRKVIQADINPFAVENAIENNKINSFSFDQIQTIQSDCFDNIPMQLFDLIVFNIPFHNDIVEIQDPLQRAFYDPSFDSTKKFLGQIRQFCHKNTQIIIAFSNKGDVDVIETIFDLSGLKWELWKLANTHQEYDNRLYRLQVK